MTGPTLLPALAVRAGTRTPCCDRVPLVVDGDRIGCRGCGTIYRNATATVAAVFGPVVDVTPTTPRRFLTGGSDA